MPPPPPPPPPPVLTAVTPPKNQFVSNSSSVSLSENEVSRACRWLIHDSPQQNSILVSFYKEIQPIIQEGPMCGLVALHMAAQLLKPYLQIETKELLSIAKQLNFTLQGEMFSVYSMAALAEKVLNCSTKIVSDDAADTFTEIVSHVLEGNPILVPYDADFNHEPCMKKGHKAHWAIITGILVCGEPGTFDLSICHADHMTPNLYYAPMPFTNRTSIIKHCNNSNTFVLARQGKSKHLCLWLYKTLKESNNNLLEVDPLRADPEKYILPNALTLNELQNKWLLLKLS